MGTYFHKQDTQINQPIEINNQNLPADNIDQKKIPDDQYLCPECWRIPEILNIHSDNGHIVLKCTYHGILDLPIKEYFQRMENSAFSYFNTKCFNCQKYQKSDKENIFQYCYECKVDLCDECIKKSQLKEKKEHSRNHLDNSIPINQLNHKFIENKQTYEFNSFCLDCENNVFEKEKSSKHKNHKIIGLGKLKKDINKYKDIIIKKNEDLNNIIKLNRIVINSYTKFSNNYFHIQSLINVGKTIEEENKRDSRVIECMINRLEISYKAQEEAIKSLQNEFTIDLNGNEKKLSLGNRNLGDRGLELISKIIFKNLKEIDISGNNIKNIKPLSEMILPHLEYLNMNNNQIEDINPIAELKAKNLKEISLQNNNIQDIGPFLKSDFPAFERLRIEKNNRINRENNSLRDLIKNKNFKNKVFYEEKTFDQFKAKYGVNLNQDYVELSGLKCGNKLIQDLYLTLKPDNKIKHLKLDNNEIEDASLLSRIPLNKLQLLDLSLNNIKNVRFLLDMKLTKLTTLYLNATEIYNIYPLIRKIDKEFNDEEEKYKRPDLKIVSLNETHLNLEDKQSKEMLKSLKSEGANNIEIDLDPENKL